jgi:hypothetical protein
MRDGVDPEVSIKFFSPSWVSREQRHALSVTLVSKASSRFSYGSNQVVRGIWVIPIPGRSVL